ncbi:MAG: oligoendopeptidase F [Lachnospiraceae bacterium]|nr:oligoendopeptidase F [Lachnospiraceae bacterium]
MAEKSVKKREDINNDYKWAIEDLYVDDNLWSKDYEKVITFAETIKSYQGRLSESPEVLYEFMQKYEEMEQLAEKVYVYANQRLHEDTGNSFYQGLAAKTQGMLVATGEATSFFEPEFLAMSEEEYEEIVANEKLKPYQHYFEEMRRERAHILTKEMEEMLALSGEMAEGPKDIFSMFNNADVRFPEVKDKNGELLPLTHGTYIALLENSDRSIREQAFKNLYGVYEKYRNTLAAVYQASVKKDVFYAKARKYASAREMELDGSNIPLSVYDNLMESVHKHLSAMHKYIDIRQEALGVEKLHMYDLYVPIIDEIDMKKDFEEAKKIVSKGLEPLGGEYLTILKEGFENHWIDIYENEGKRSGAYSWGAYGTHPYVLLNYNGTLNHVFTLAHEMGHALHSFYSDANQDYLYAGYKIFVAEVASTVNESLLIQYLISQAKDAKEKAYLLNHFLEQFRGTLYRQTMFAEFEKRTHEMVENSEALTAEKLCEIYYDLNKQYFGENIHIDEEIAMEWARIPHFYTAFYVYQYATGFSAAIAISKAILAGDEEVKEGYFKFLKSGSSMYPIDLLKLCKVDMTTTKPVEDALKVFEELLDEFMEVIKECK